MASATSNAGAALSGAMATADGIIVVSEYMRSLLVAADPQLAPDLHVLSRPIRDLGSLRPRLRAATTEPAVVTYAGRITAEKGLATVIEALATIRSSTPVALHIAGVVEDDQYWTSCQELLTTATRTNAQLSWTYLGHLDYDATDELFRRSDIVTVPSCWPEPLGAVALEAMAAGAAVIASPVGGLADVVVHGHNGVHAEPGDVAAWSDALATLLERPDLARRLGQQGHTDVSGTVIDDHLRDLDTLVARYSDRRPPSHALPTPRRQQIPAPTVGGSTAKDLPHLNPRTTTEASTRLR